MIGEILIELLGDGVLELLWDSVARPASCPKCQGRLKHVPGAPDQRQCVMCERLWQKSKAKLTFVGYPRNPLSIK